MRKTLLFLLLSASGVANAQDSLAYGAIPFKEGRVIYEKVIEVAGQSRESLYNRAKAWALSSFKSQKDALQADDKESGLLAYKTYFSLQFVAPPFLGYTVTSYKQYWQTIKVLLKDGKAKVVISDISIKDDPVGNSVILPAVPIEEYIANLGTPAPIVVKSFNKKQMEKYKEYLAESKEKHKEQFRQANEQFQGTISGIEAYLTGKAKSDFDF